MIMFKRDYFERMVTKQGHSKEKPNTPELAAREHPPSVYRARVGRGPGDRRSLGELGNGSHPQGEIWGGAFQIHLSASCWRSHWKPERRGPWCDPRGEKGTQCLWRQAENPQRSWAPSQAQRACPEPSTAPSRTTIPTGPSIFLPS